MDWFTLTAQLIGLVAMAFNILSYQQATRKRVIAFQMVGTFLFSINFFMLGAIMGCILNALSAVRAVIFLNKEKLRADRLSWFIGFVAVYLISYAMTFTVFGMEPTVKNLILEFLPVIGMIAITISFRLSDAKAIRKYALISSPCWLIYNCTVPSTGGIICEVFNMISIVVGLIRYKKADTE